MLMKGALLHDIGKILYRADRSVGNHSSAGKDFLSHYVDSTAESQQLLRCVDYHHSKRIKSAKISDDDWAYLVYEADNLASAIDRREEEGIEYEGSKFDANMPLYSVFHTFGGTVSNEKCKYYLRGLDSEQPFNYPVTQDIKASDDKYKLLVEDLKNNLANGINSMACDEILRFYEDITAYIPSSTNKEEVPDISLYMHSKITAALAVCMKQYFDANGITNYKDKCLSHSETFRKEQAFMLVSGDFSGIQNFIYTIPSKGALKSLRGRSFYLEILLEHIIDSILNRLELSRANVLYTGGGHFYLILPNTVEAKDCIVKVTDEVNQWLLKQIGSSLYLATGMAVCAGEDLRNSSGQRATFSAVSSEVKKAKLQRYNKEILGQLFDQSSEYNLLLDSSRECSICHTSTTKLAPYGDSDTKEACSICSGLFDLGAAIVKHENSCFVVAYLKSTADKERYKRIPVYGDNVFLYVVPIEKLASFEKEHVIVRIYGKNKAVTGAVVSTRIWLADYAAKNKNDEVLELSALSELSGSDNIQKEHSSTGNKGIDRLGVLRADVDNLGAAFISGFVGGSKQEASKASVSEADTSRYGTFSRYADLSRDLSLFFKVGVNKLAKGEVPKESSGIELFSLFVDRKGNEQPVHVIYSGGDDVFMVGAWDALIELAVDIRQAFKAFTQGKLTISAGLGFFSPTYPISKMADLAGDLESQAKGNPNKDSFALFGVEPSHDGTGMQCKHIHQWDEFIDGVCGEKLKLFTEAASLAEDKDPILPLSRSSLYKLVELIRAYDADSINLARILYALARIQPIKKKNTAEHLKKYREEFYQQFVNTIYKWVRNKNKRDRKELLTALTLLLYFEREKNV